MIDIANIRLQTQQIVSPAASSVSHLITQLGAVQAQDFAMAKWALGLRLPQATEKTIEEAFNRGEIIRTHVLRPTWHFVPAQDVDWMLQLTAPRLLTSYHARRTELGIDAEILQRCLRILDKNLVGGNAFTKEELLIIFSRQGLSLDSSIFYHLLMYAELERIVCSGPLKNGKQSYTLLSERVPAPIQKTKEEALATLAYRYITTRGPVCLADFVWWSGLPITEARQAFELNKPHCVTETINGQAYWMPSSIVAKTVDPMLHLLPAFDEFLICYRHREAVIAKDISPKAISSNGIFRPIVVQDGQVAGIWKRISKPRGVEIEITQFTSLNGKAVGQAIERLEKFWEKKVTLIKK